MKLPIHLGGHMNVTHIDEGTIDYMMGKYNIKSSYDLGCGPGGMVDLMNNKGIESTGIDGDYTISRKCPIIIHDFNTGGLELDIRDLCWSVEFLEHVYEQYMDNYFTVFNVCKYVVCTANSNENQGHHHVNAKPSSYWIDKFKERGFEYNKEDTVYIKKNNAMKREFIKNTGLVFHNLNIS